MSEKQIRERVERTREVEFWGHASIITPALVPQIFGDGLAWLKFVPLNTRPAVPPDQPKDLSHGVSVRPCASHRKRSKNVLIQSLDTVCGILCCKSPQSVYLACTEPGMRVDMNPAIEMPPATATISLRLSRDLMDGLRKKADEEDRTLNGLIAFTLKKSLGEGVQQK